MAGHCSPAPLFPCSPAPLLPQSEFGAPLRSWFGQAPSWAGGRARFPLGPAGRPHCVEYQSQAAACTAPDRTASGDRVCLELAGTLSSLRLARRATAVVVRRWRLPGLVDAVVLVVSELVTNAVRHGLPPVRLVLSRRERGLRVEVHDQAPDAPPFVGAARELDESGRGMGIVRALATDTGVEQTPGGGKAVYAVFDRPGDTR